MTKTRAVMIIILQNFYCQLKTCTKQSQRESVRDVVVNVLV